MALSRAAGLCRLALRTQWAASHSFSSYATSGEPTGEDKQPGRLVDLEELRQQRTLRSPAEGKPPVSHRNPLHSSKSSYEQLKLNRAIRDSTSVDAVLDLAAARLAKATQVFVTAGVMQLPSGITTDCVPVLDNGAGMSAAMMNGSLLRLGQNEEVEHGFHSLNGHGAKKAGEHLGRETMYLSKTEAGYAVGRMGASTNELSVSNDLTMTAEFASLGEVSALDRAISSSTTTPSAPTGRSCARCWRASRRQLARWSSSASTTPTRASRWMLPVG